MPPPTPAEQIRFLTNVQRLLAEGLFTATYKYALIAALADLSVEVGDDSGKALPLSTFAIAEKFVEYYWRHAIPYATANGERVLRQNTGQPAKIVSLVEEARRGYGDSLASFMRNGQAWRRLVRKVESVVKVMPLWKLQTVGNEKLDFLYGPVTRRTGSSCGPALRTASGSSIRSFRMQSGRPGCGMCGASTAICWARPWIFVSSCSERRGTRSEQLARISHK